jgi:hypothetical protein
MVDFSVARVVQISELFGILYFAITLLAAKALGKCRNGYSKTCGCYNFVHTQSFSKQAKSP